jgi:hypothetical protein
MRALTVLLSVTLSSWAIATRLGNALVAPVMAYVPEGAIDPPSGHMRYAGTLSLPVEVFVKVLEHTARSGYGETDPGAPKGSVRVGKGRKGSVRAGRSLANIAHKPSKVVPITESRPTQSPSWV